MPLSLEDKLFVNQGDKTYQDNFKLGRTFNVWIAPLLDTQERPVVVPISTASAISAGATTANLSATEEITLYRNTPLKFGSNLAIVKATTTIDTTAAAVPLFPVASAIAIGDADAYQGLVPFMSVKEGGRPDSSSSMAEAHNKNMGLYSVSQKYKEDYSASMTGDINFTDPAVPILELIDTGGLSKIYVQLRHALSSEFGDRFYGEGPFAVEYVGVPTAKITDGESAFIGFTLEVKVSGRLEQYKIL